jgi:hypothetical protein
MTSWGAVLLVSYIVLGLSPLRTREAVRIAVGLTAVVLVVARGALL